MYNIVQNWPGVAGLALALILAVVLILLWKKGYITDRTIELTADALDTLPAIGGGQFLSALDYYTRLAVRSVEQMVKSGQLEKDDEQRKNKAMELVESYALVDGVELDDKDKDAAYYLIEAEVAELPATGEINKPPEEK